MAEYKLLADHSACVWPPYIKKKERKKEKKTLASSSDFPCGSDGKASACNAGDPGSTPGLGRSSGEGNGNPLRYSCLENPMNREVW